MLTRSGTIVAVCISRERGERKSSVASAACRVDYGIEGDAHAGPGIRQVSFLAMKDIREMEALGIELQPGDFAENIIVDSDVLDAIQPGDMLQVEGGPAFIVTQIGKDCHNDNCPIKIKTGTCVMPERGVFTRVITSGTIQPGQHITQNP